MPLRYITTVMMPAKAQKTYPAMIASPVPRGATKGAELVQILSMLTLKALKAKLPDLE